MLVKLTDFHVKHTFYLDCRNVRVVQHNTVQERKPSGKREEIVAEIKPTAPTTVVTYTMLPNGFQAFDVMEETEEVARAINAAWQGKSLLIN